MQRRRFRALVAAAALAITFTSSGSAIAAKGGNPGGGGGTEVIDFSGKLPIDPIVPVPFVDACALPNLDAILLVTGDVQYQVKLTLGRGGRLADLRLHLNFGDLGAQPLLGGILGSAHYTVNGTVNTNQKIDFTSGSGKLEPVNGHFFILRAGNGNDLKLSFQLKGNLQGNGSITDALWDFGPSTRTISLLGLTVAVHQAECGEFGKLF